MVADCVPVALVDPEARVLAAVHAGWRGTAGGAVAKALDAMAALGARPERVRAYLGPAVSPLRYQVNDAVRDALADAVGPDDLDPGVAGPTARATGWWIWWRRTHNSCAGPASRALHRPGAPRHGGPGTLQRPGRPSLRSLRPVRPPVAVTDGGATGP